MGWCMYVPSCVVLQRASFHGREDVEAEIADTEKEIEKARSFIVMCCYGDLEKIAGEHSTDYSGMREVIGEVLDGLESLTKYRLDLVALKDNWECRLGDFVENPDFDENFKKWINDEYLYNDREGEADEP